ncbi:hypothetical protein CWM43_26750, partial [Escherichia coli]|uniref:hypothetical protein n=1 Tax=Escherichia coli TaxID=562 RepID=UPI000CB28095
VQAGPPCPLFGFPRPPAGGADQALGPGLYPAPFLGLENEGKKIRREGEGLRGQPDALNKQL